MSGPQLAVPPGRAGRNWLVRRLATARDGAGLLDRKLRILEAELGARRAAADRAGGRWADAQADAERWLLRAALLGGQRAIRLAAAAHPAEVTVSYAAVMGIRYPSGVSCSVPAPGTEPEPALARARQAHAAALAAAADQATAAAALRILEAETATTRYRLRAVRDRWIPRLEAALAQVSFAIEEQERADAARLRRAAPVRPAAGRTGSG